MLDDQDFIDYIHDSKELLKKNLQVGKIPEQFGKAVRTVVDNIVVLLQKTTKKPKSDLGIFLYEYYFITYLVFIYYFGMSLLFLIWIKVYGMNSSELMFILPLAV